MKHIILILILSTSFGILAQGAMEIPNASPQSPNAYQFTKYGEVSVNESTGAISPSIPLYTYNAGGIQIPINLGYSGNGVRVTQEPTWAGINWNLMPGGVITRQVRDIPDETASGDKKQFYTKQELNELEGYNVILEGELENEVDNEIFTSFYSRPGSEWHRKVTKIATSPTVDSEVDIFNYNFLGYSGSFYLDEDNNKAHLLKNNKELDIRFYKAPSNKSYIIIITPNGDAYFFGGEDASESSKTYTASGAGSGSNAASKFAQNAFYLYRIAPYNGGFVNFSYEQVNATDTNPTPYYPGYVIGQQEQLSKIHYVDYTALPCSREYFHIRPKDVFLQTESRIVLNKISSSFSDTYVEFSSKHLGSKKNMSRKRQLEAVYIKDGADEILKEFELTYLTVDKEDGYDNKFYLTDVTLLDKNATQVQKYSLTYNSPNLIPSRMSLSRDYNGYYNGNLGRNNKTLLPYDPRFSGTIALANRDVNPITIKYGSLQKITYPTGGYSIFDYESPVKSYTTETKEYAAFVYHNDPTRNGANEYEDNIFYATDGFFSFDANEKVHMRLQATVKGDLTHHNSFSVIGVRNGVETELYTLPIGNPSNTTITYNENITVTIPRAGSYYFKFRYNPHSSVLIHNDQSLVIGARLGIDIPDLEVSIPEYYPSLRVKRVTSAKNLDSSPIIKRYYYNRIGRLGTENNILMKEPNFVNKTSRGLVSLGSRCEGNPTIYINLSANSLTNMYADDSQNILYRAVTVSYGGDDFELGGKESFFRVFPEEIGDTYFVPTVNNGHQLDMPTPYATSGLSDGNGTLQKERYYSYNKEEDDFKLLKEDHYFYSILPDGDIRYNIKPYVVVVAAPVLYDIREYNFNFYKIQSKTHLLDKVVTTDYSWDNTNPIITERLFEYGKYVDRHISEKTTDSKGNVSENKFYYPEYKLLDDAKSNLGITNEEKRLHKKLADQNRISEPYLVENFYNNILLSAKHTVFSDEWYTNRIWPKYIKTSKATNRVLGAYENRIVFTDYNFYGRLEEVAQADGSVTRYQYNTHQQVILKIENYDPTEIVIDDAAPLDTPCYYQDKYPTSLVTRYHYDTTNDNLVRIEDPRCNTIDYHYDDYNRLMKVTDQNDHIVSEHRYNHKN